MLQDLLERTEDVSSAWWEQAACRGMDTEIFFYKDSYAGNARQICKGCPVRMECLQEAMDTEPSDYRHGIWGGLSSGERRVLSRQRRKWERDRGVTPE